MVSSIHRPAHLKQKIPRPPAPIPRKRRGSIRSRPPQRNITSEGDMEQADEMGDEGEGDDGFVDGMDTGLSKRKTKKKLSERMNAACMAQRVSLDYVISDNVFINYICVTIFKINFVN